MSTLFFDTETMKILDGLLAPPLVLGSFCTASGDPWLLDPDRTASAVEYAIENEEVLVGLNVAYDLAVIAEHRPALLVPIWNHYRKGLVRCVVVRQKLLDIATGQLKFHDDEDGKAVKSEYSMKALAARFLDLNIAKGEETWRLRYGELYGIPLDQIPEDARQYSLDDATITRALFYKQNNGLPLTNEKEQTIAAWALHLMSCWGMRVDGEYLAEVKGRLTKQRVAGRQALIENGFYKGTPFTSEDRDKGKEPDFYEPYKAKHLVKQGKLRPMKWARDMAKIKARVERQFGRKGLKAPKTDGGDISTEKDVLERSGSFLLQKLADQGAIDKMLQTYVPAMEAGVEAPLNPGLNVLVNTGRTSSFRPNIQNMPAGRRPEQDIRPAFIPRPGYLYCSIDYSTLELRALAHWCELNFGFSKMADALRAGKDLHLAMAASMLGLDYEEAKRRKSDPEVSRHRDLAKPANFGFPGGMSALTLVDYARKSYGVIMDEETAFRLKDQFMKDWPEMELYFRLHAALPGIRNGEASYEQLYSGRVRGGMSFCDACNGRFQGLSADGFKAAFVEVSYEAYCVPESPLYGCRPVAPIHDEIFTEMPVDGYEAAVARKDEIMKREMGRYMPGIPIETSPAVMHRWYKKAEAVYATDAGGIKRLIPWVPKAAALSKAA